MSNGDPTPVLGLKNTLAFPFIIYECKRQAGSLTWAENQAAHAAAKALYMLHDLLEQTTDSEKFTPFVLMFASSGSYWSVFLGTKTGQEVHLIRLWIGSVDDEWWALNLLVIVHRIKEWGQTVFKPAGVRMLEDLHDGMRSKEQASKPTSTFDLQASRNV